MIRLALMVTLTLSGCVSLEGSTRSWPSEPGFSRTAYRIPLQGSAVRSETVPCVRACRSRRTTDGYFRCLESCPYVRVRPGPCRPSERPPGSLCLEQIVEAGGGSGADAADLARLVAHVGAACN
jgi:hypothetical protein